MHLAIHVDGGPKAGLGHVTRGIALAEGCQSVGLTVVFIVYPSLGLEAFLRERGQLVQVCEAATPKDILKAVESTGSVALAIDNYRIDDEELFALKKQGLFIVYFADCARSNLPVDIVINGSPIAPKLSYKVLPSTHLLCGLQYQIVRSEFIQTSMRRYDIVRSLFVSVGGANLSSILNPLIKFLHAHTTSLLNNITINIVVGHFADISDFSSFESLKFHHSPRDIRSLMSNADLAISAGGQTLYELARCGTPTIAFCAGEDQGLNLAALEQQSESIINVGCAWNQDWLDHLYQALQDLLSNPCQRAQMGTSSTQLIDGQGATRIARVIRSLITI